MKIELSKKSVSAILGFSIAIFTYVLVFLIIPFPKNGASWVTFAFTFISALFGICVSLVAFKDCETLKSKFYGFPIFRIGFIYVIAQFVLGVIICIIASFIDLAAWVPFIISVILLAIASIGVIAADNARDAIVEIDAQTERVTKAVKMFNLNIQSTVDLCADEAVKKELIKLAEAFKYSDPVSSEYTVQTEDLLYNEINVLHNLVQNNASAECMAQITKVSNLLNERNRLCKAYKGY